MTGPQRALVVSILAAVVVIGILGYLAVGGFDKSMCVVSVVRRVSSPDRRLEAVIFERDCGATTDFGTNLSVVKAGSAIADAGGNLLVADSDHGRAPLDSGNVIHLLVEWIGSDSLVVRYDGRARLFQQAGQAQGVSVRYAVIDSRGA